MTLTERIENLRSMLSAEDNGEAIDFRYSTSSEWKPCSSSVRDFYESVIKYPESYRIRPKPVTRPWGDDEVPVGKVIRWKKESGCRGRWVIGGVVDGLIFSANNMSGRSADEYLRNATMDDGSPCGVTE